MKYISISEETNIKLCELFNVEYTPIETHFITTQNLVTSAFRGLKHTEESKELIRQANLGEKNPMFGVKRKKHHNYGKTGPLFGKFGSEHPMFGFKMSESSKEKIKKANLGEKNPMFGKKHPIVKCPHCNKSGSQNGMKRWHFNNCRLNILT